jgi:hypothetical protein
MAILTNGLLGNSSKTIGNIVTYTSGGQQIARTKPSHYSDAKTENQQLQRVAFALILSMFRLISPAVKVAFPERQGKHSAYNVFMKENVPVAVTGALGSQSINFSSVIAGKGSLLKPRNVALISDITDRIDISWDNNTNNTTGFGTDKAVITVFNPTKNEAETDIFSAQRQTAGHNLSVPSSWQGDTVHVYVSFVSGDNGKASDSVYAGSVSVSA